MAHRAKTKILFIAASPQDAPRLELEQEYNNIESELQRTEYRDSFELERRSAVSVVDLQRLLLQSKPDIVHFSGHGSEKGALFFEDRAGFVEELSPNALTNLFAVINRDGNPIRCVILDACYSQIQAKNIGKHVDCIIGMSSVISERAATKFSVSFYRSLGYGKSLGDAFDFGRNQLELESTSEEETPKLHCKPDVVASKIFYTGPNAPTISSTDHGARSNNGGRSIFADRKREILIAIIAGPMATIIALAWPAVAQFVEDVGQPSIVNLGFAEDCESFSPNSIVVSKIGQDWKIVDESGGFELLDFKTNNDNAERGAEVIKKYGFNEMCFVGRPFNALNNPVLPMMYFLVNGTAAMTNLNGNNSTDQENCSMLTERISAREVADRWLVLDGNVKIYDFGTYQRSKENAERGAEVIKAYGFNRLCQIERPFQPMIYFLKGPPSGITPTTRNVDSLSYSFSSTNGDSSNERASYFVDSMRIFDSIQMVPRTAYADVTTQCGPNNATVVGGPVNATVTDLNDASAPSLTVSWPPSGALVRPSFKIIGTAEDSGTGVSTVEVLISYPNSVHVSDSAIREGEIWDNWHYDVSGLGDGSYSIIVRAIDLACNQFVLPSIAITVDSQPPTIVVPANMILEATGPAGAPASFSVSTQDNYALLANPACFPASNSVFPIETTTVSCTITDAAGNVGEETFTITVRDTIPPTLAMPSDIVVQATSESGAIVNYLASASDTVNGSLTPSCSPASGSTFEIRETAVTCTVQDAHGNRASASFVITVQEQDDDVEVLNLHPDAHAGRDQTVDAGSLARLDGALSFDTDGGIADYRWSQISGFPVTLVSANTAHPTFIAPQVFAGQSLELQFRVTITDNQGSTDTDDVKITVTAPDSFNLHTTLDGNSYEMWGSSSGVTPISFTIEPETSSIHVDLSDNDNAATDRAIELHFTEDIISDIYAVETNGGENVEFETIPGAADSISIRFIVPQDTSFVEISATRVIPEFSSSVLVISVVAVGMILVMVYGRQKPNYGTAS